MLEIEYNGKIYPFQFGMGFLKEINKKYKEMPAMGVSTPAGFKYSVSAMLDGNMDALADILMAANKFEKPRITERDLFAYLDDEDTDIAGLVEEVKDFLSKSNACKFIMDQIMALLSKEQKAEA